MSEKSDKAQHSHSKHSAHSHEMQNWLLYGVLGLVVVMLALNQLSIGVLKNTAVSGRGISVGSSSGSASVAASPGNIDLSGVDISQIQSTAQAVNALFPIDQIKTADDAIAMMIPTGTPPYGEQLGISFDDPVNALNGLAKMWYSLKDEVKPETWERFISLATKPVGISCEYCCGVGPVGITAEGRMRCGCKHNPGVLAVTLWLMEYTDWSDAQILQEAMKWKTLWFPKNMVGIATQLAGGDTSLLKDVPGMVGGC